jgi:hypothetical protein
MSILKFCDSFWQRKTFLCGTTLEHQGKVFFCRNIVSLWQRKTLHPSHYVGASGEGFLLLKRCSSLSIRHLENAQGAHSPKLEKRNNISLICWYYRNSEGYTQQF